MIIVANSEAGSGIHEAVEILQAGRHGLDALETALNRVEEDPKVRSVGYGGWPNLIGEMEFDAGVMDGTTRRTGSVGALRGVVHAVSVARRVMTDLNHEMLVGEGACRFASESGFTAQPTLFPDSKKVWWEKLEGMLSADEQAKFPDLPLAPLNSAITDPEKVRDTSVFLTIDSHKGIHAATSTSGWAWKYPGRLGDSPIVGAGFYADSRYGAAACTHTGEMTMRAGTSRTIVLAMKLGYSLEDAVKIAVDELRDLETGYLDGVVIHALDASGNHRVVNFRNRETIRYWYWDDTLASPEQREAETLAD
ncbi:N(4)-(beta-N-acetylglucosaminyl)-L-asparaginase [Thalassospira marina]|uniref:Asparaginase n=1 Tax=Thalassospira marina TaxID=2048283 RepID=A0ABM6QC46_9PROT|nr:N(4)-(beta-N-acetylglucosaminyl)-L-asparaginase [Thalassospira marina]AUG54136.1 asparaginase [Thalassospira marina]